MPPGHVWLYLLPASGLMVSKLMVELGPQGLPPASERLHLLARFMLPHGLYHIAPCSLIGS